MPRPNLGGSGLRSMSQPVQCVLSGFEGANLAVVASDEHEEIEQLAKRGATQHDGAAPAAILTSHIKDRDHVV